MSIVEVNSVKYRKKPEPQKSVKIATMEALFLQLALGGMAGMPVSSRRRVKRNNINIPEEYGLIQNKKSKLSASERNSVVAIFERDYEKI